MFINYFTNNNFGCLNPYQWNFGFPNFNFVIPKFFNFGCNNFTPNFDIFSQHYLNYPTHNYQMSIWDNFSGSNYNYNYNFNLNYNNNFSNSFTPTYNIFSKNPSSNTYERSTNASLRSVSSSSSSRRVATEAEESCDTTEYTGVLSDYNSKKGEELGRLAEDYSGRFLDRSTQTIGAEGKSTLWSHSDNKKNPICAAYVKTAIRDAGLGEYESGDAYQMIDILDDNENFRRIDSANVNVRELPAGCILVYDRGVGGYNRTYGHTEITLGDGTCASQAITQHPESRGIPTAIYIPV